MSHLNIYKQDGQTISIEKVVHRLWDNRDNKDETNSLIEKLSVVLQDRVQFENIEFFLPQLSHMIINLHPDEYDVPLERLAVMISLVSPHTASLLTFALVAAMEDFQPELAHGEDNPNKNSKLYFRCAHLMKNIERAVVMHGSEKKLALEESSGSAYYTSAFEVFRYSRPITMDGKNAGELYYKRQYRKGALRSKPWKLLYFVIDEQVLFCYHDIYTPKPKRAFPLFNCKIIAVDNHPEFGNTKFEIEDPSSGVVYELRARSETERAEWIKKIKGEMDYGIEECCSSYSAIGGFKLIHQERSLARLESTKHFQESSMTNEQIQSLHHFREQRHFVIRLTDVCERLRFKEKEVRKHFLRRDLTELRIPPLGYMPICSSLDPYRAILRCVADEGYAFTTKARCPALILFEMERHPAKDVASFLKHDVPGYPEKEIQVQIDLTDNSENDGEAVDVSDVSADMSNDDGQFVESGSKFREKGNEIVWNIGEASKYSNVKMVTTFNGETIMGESFAEKTVRVRSSSAFQHLTHWELDGLIAKSNDDLRQEVFVMQLIEYYQRIFKNANLPLWLLSYKIQNTSQSTGLIQLIPNAISIDGLKKKSGFPGTLRAYYEKTYGYQAGQPEPLAFVAAMEAYVSSMAAYSVVTYMLAIKDRHNGNVMIDRDGHVIHIDFGFVFGLAPGKAFSMEKAPWKLTKEMAEVMGGKRSPYFAQYIERCCSAFLEARKHEQDIVKLMEIMTFSSNYPAFRYNSHAIEDFKARQFTKKSENEVRSIVRRFIEKSYGHSGTNLYDDFQLATNGIAK